MLHFETGSDSNGNTSVHAEAGSARRHGGVDGDAEQMRGRIHKEKQDIKDSNCEMETKTKKNTFHKASLRRKFKEKCSLFYLLLFMKILTFCFMFEYLETAKTSPHGLLRDFHLYGDI